MNTTACRLLRGRPGLNVPSVYPVVTPTRKQPPIQQPQRHSVVARRHVRKPLQALGQDGRLPAASTPTTARAATSTLDVRIAMPPVWVCMSLDWFSIYPESSDSPSLMHRGISPSISAEIESPTSASRSSSEELCSLRISAEIPASIASTKAPIDSSETLSTRHWALSSGTPSSITPSVNAAMANASHSTQDDMTSNISPLSPAVSSVLSRTSSSDAEAAAASSPNSTNRESEKALTTPSAMQRDSSAKSRPPRSSSAMSRWRASTISCR